MVNLDQDSNNLIRKLQPLTYDDDLLDRLRIYFKLYDDYEMNELFKMLKRREYDSGRSHQL